MLGSGTRNSSGSSYDPTVEPAASKLTLKPRVLEWSFLNFLEMSPLGTIVQVLTRTEVIWDHIDHFYSDIIDIWRNQNFENEPVFGTFPQVYSTHTYAEITRYITHLT